MKPVDSRFWSKVADIRSFVELGWTQTEVAQAYGVSQVRVSQLVTRGDHSA